jgi:hypothetical protein
MLADCKGEPERRGGEDNDPGGGGGGCREVREVSDVNRGSKSENTSWISDGLGQYIQLRYSYHYESYPYQSRPFLSISLHCPRPHVTSNSRPYRTSGHASPTSPPAIGALLPSEVAFFEVQKRTI